MGGTPTDTPAIGTEADNNNRTDATSVAMKTGFALSYTLTTGTGSTVPATNIGKNLLTSWSVGEYAKDQRGSGNRQTSDKNYPGAYAPE